MITTEQLKELIRADSARQLTVAKQAAYVLGNNPAIYEPEAKEEPDNRIAVPFARRAVNMVCGYLGKEGNIQYKGTGFDSDIEATFDANDEGLITSELLRVGCTHGEAFELHWQESGQKYFAQVPIAQSIPIWSKSLKPKLEGFIRYWHEKDRSTIAEVYDAISIQTFVRKTDSAEFEPYDDARPHGYKRVPVVRYTVDMDSRNIFDHCIALIDAYDKIISENYANDLQGVARALLLVAGEINKEPLDSPDGISLEEKLLSGRVKYLEKLLLEGTGSVTDKVAYLTKNIDSTFPQSAADIFERLIYEMLQLFNPNDEAFNTPSGVAAKYKLLGFEYLCTQITTYFMRGLQDRIKLLKGINQTLTGESQNTDVTIDWQRNLPDDIEQTARVAVMLGLGKLSDEVLIGLFPDSVIPDKVKELKALEESAKEQEEADRLMTEQLAQKTEEVNAGA
jgi:SPP1 family phage portal protein